MRGGGIVEDILPILPISGVIFNFLQVLFRAIENGRREKNDGFCPLA